MAEFTVSSATRPLSIRLLETDIEDLCERARRISGTPTGVARELIRSGLSDGDPFQQANRLLKIERNLAIAMPELGRSTVHYAGLALIREWVEALPGSC